MDYEFNHPTLSGVAKTSVQSSDKRSPMERAAMSIHEELDGIDRQIGKLRERLHPVLVDGQGRGGDVPVASEAEACSLHVGSLNEAAHRIRIMQGHLDDLLHRLEV